MDLWGDGEARKRTWRCFLLAVAKYSSCVVHTREPFLPKGWGIHHDQHGMGRRVRKKQDRSGGRAE